MSKHRKKQSALVPILIVLLLLAVGAATVWFLLQPKSEPGPALETALAGLEADAARALADADAEVGSAAAQAFRLESNGDLRRSFRSAEGTVTRRWLDADMLTAGLDADMQALLEMRAESAKRRADLYGEDGGLLPEVAESLYADALMARLEDSSAFCRSETLPVSLRYRDGRWQLDAGEALATPPKLSLPGWEAAAAALTPVEFSYSLPDWTSPGPVPDSRCYGETTDPQVVAALLTTETAKRLINGQALDFDPARDMLGRTIYYYLDESILAIVWQQDEHGAVGTFAEVLIADASQLRRKLADDTFGTLQYYTPTEFAAQTNAVVACSGDFYNSGRADFGLYVYNGRLMRSGLSAGQSCLITDEGDLLFTYEKQFSSDAEAQQFIDDNHVMFSLNFGPVMVDKGVDVTPYDYLFGEVLDTYARCAIGQLGKRHYLAMTINCESPDHYVYVTLRQAADSMIAHNCYNAYTLDGGQTGSILIGGRLINPVQFGVERPMSDIYYFATAIADD